MCFFHSCRPDLLVAQPISRCALSKRVGFHRPVPPAGSHSPPLFISVSVAIRRRDLQSLTSFLQPLETDCGQPIELSGCNLTSGQLVNLQLPCNLPAPPTPNNKLA